MPPELTPKEQVLQRWLAKARNDLESARCLLGDPKPIADTACFHCQQAVEKLLKAVLILHEEEPPRVHALDVLFDAAGKLEGSLTEHRLACVWLTAYAVETRYPDSVAEPTVERGRQALAATEALCELVLTIVPQQTRP
jgi:HEPN domain-containing protein